MDQNFSAGEEGVISCLFCTKTCTVISRSSAITVIIQASLTLQIQNPFYYCQFGNFLSSAPELDMSKEELTVEVISNYKRL